MPDPSVHLIAEAGTNHNGDVATGKRLVDAAVAARASSVKFQMIFPEGLYLPAAWENGRRVDSEVFKRRAETALSPGDYAALAEYCHDRGIPFSASAFDRKGIELLDRLNAPYIKIASCDLNNTGLLVAAAETGRKLIVSTGMSTLEEIEEAVRAVLSTGHNDLVLMHCLSVYPCPTRLANLAFIDTLRQAFGLEVGFSDHTESSTAAILAVGKGATWIEKHLTLDRSMSGFDHAYAMEPDALAGYAEDLRSASEALAVPVEKVPAEEATVRTRARRALYAARDIHPGEVIEEDAVLIVRPEGPLPPSALGRLLGCTATKEIRQYEAFAWEAVERVELELLEPIQEATCS